MVSFCSFQISFPNTCTVLIFFIAGLLFLCLEHVEHWERIASRWRPAFSSHLISRASSTGRCNTIQRIDSAMLLHENHLFGCTRPKPSQGSVPAGLSLASKFAFCFQCEESLSLVLHRPIETTALIRTLPAWVPELKAIKDLTVGPLG